MCMFLHERVARARSLIFNTLLERLSDDVLEGTDMLMSENDVLETTEKLTLQRFRKKICQHLVRRAVTDSHFAGLDTVFQPKVSDVYMTGFRSGRGAPILGPFWASLMALSLSCSKMLLLML
jgi:hypothetical protein